MDEQMFKMLWDATPIEKREVYKCLEKPGFSIEVIRNGEGQIIGRAFCCELVKSEKEKELEKEKEESKLQFQRELDWIRSFQYPREESDE